MSTHTLTVSDVQATWPAGLLTYSARVALPDGSMATLKSRASIYHGRMSPVLTLSPDDHTVTLFGAWESLASSEPGDFVDFAAGGHSAAFLDDLEDRIS